jgi:hypothetical protein
VVGMRLAGKAVAPDDRDESRCRTDRASRRLRVVADPSSYLLCGTPRTRSTLLCGLLTSTGVAGCPESYFRQPDGDPLRGSAGRPMRSTPTGSGATAQHNSGPPTSRCDAGRPPAHATPCAGRPPLPHRARDARLGRVRSAEPEAGRRAPHLRTQALMAILGIGISQSEPASCGGGPPRTGDRDEPLAREGTRQ